MEKVLLFLLFQRQGAFKALNDCRISRWIKVPSNKINIWVIINLKVIGANDFWSFTSVLPLSLSHSLTLFSPPPHCFSLVFAPVVDFSLFCSVDEYRLMLGFHTDQLTHTYTHFPLLTSHERKLSHKCMHVRNFLVGDYSLSRLIINYKGAAPWR